MSKWSIRNRASVMTFDVEVSVYMREQLMDAVLWLGEHNYSYEWDYFAGDSLELDRYTLRVPQMCWANNLEEFAKILKNTDYNSDVPEENK